MYQALDLSLEKFEILHQRLADDLAEKSWSIVPNYFETALIKALQQDLLAYRNADELNKAGIGRGDAFKIDGTVRSDKIHWLSKETLAQTRYLDIMENLRTAMNRHLFLGLFEYESHFALYEPGAFYRKHVDSLRGAANRILTTVTYLNDRWQTEDGGFLVLFHPVTGAETARIKPKADALIVFLSEEIPHEVEQTHRTRASIAGWFRCNASIAGDIDPLT